jgi:hypothetical protein
VHEASTALVRLKTQVDLKEASIADEEKNLATLTSTFKEVNCCSPLAHCHICDIHV